MEIHCRCVELTLTMRMSTNLPTIETALIFSRALDKFLRNEQIAKLFRVCQITYDLYNPHDVVFPHVHLLCVYNDLLAKNEALIRGDQICGIWQRSVGCDYRPVIVFKDIPADVFSASNN